MTAPVPTIEPDTVLAGDTWTWTRSFPDYPATDGWVLTYYFKKEDAAFTALATASSQAYLITVAAATTAAYKLGRYRWSARASLSGQSFVVSEGEMEVRADPAAAGHYDFRTRAQRIVCALEELSLRRAGGRQQVNVDGIMLTFDSLTEILKALTYWSGVVEAEQNADRLKKGLGSLRTVRARL